MSSLRDILAADNDSISSVKSSKSVSVQSAKQNKATANATTNATTTTTTNKKRPKPHDQDSNDSFPNKVIDTTTFEIQNQSQSHPHHHHYPSTEKKKEPPISRKTCVNAALNFFAKANVALSSSISSSSQNHVIDNNTSGISPIESLSSCDTPSTGGLNWTSSGNNSISISYL